MKCHYITLVHQRQCKSKCPCMLWTWFLSAVHVSQEPEASGEGLGGTYFFMNEAGRRAAIVKPCDEEPLAPNNPKVDTCVTRMCILACNVCTNALAWPPSYCIISASRPKQALEGSALTCRVTCNAGLCGEGVG